MISLQAVNARAGKFVLKDISFTIPQGGYGVVIGPAGAGKTTLLETIAGVVRTTSGRVAVAGVDVTTTPPERRGLGIVYQHAYLFPHLNVRENIAYGTDSKADAEEITERFGISALADRDVTALSGGERQLVAMARSLARKPNVLLLDEPFAALDPRTRNTARRLLRAIYFERQFTVLQVTHDFTEAGLLGDIAIMLDRGRILQQGEPEAMFRKPASPYIADFLGAENVFAGVVAPIVAEVPAQIADDAASLTQRAIAFTTGVLTFYALGDVPPGPAHAVVRAEEISLSVEQPMSAAASASSVQNHFHGRIIEIAPVGPIARVTVDADGTPIVAIVTTRSVHELALVVGAQVIAAFKATAVHLC